MGDCGNSVFVDILDDTGLILSSNCILDAVIPQSYFDKTVNAGKIFTPQSINVKFESSTGFGVINCFFRATLKLLINNEPKDLVINVGIVADSPDFIWNLETLVLSLATTWFLLTIQVFLIESLMWIMFLMQ